jgi:hypothetical protein
MKYTLLEVVDVARDLDAAHDLDAELASGRNRFVTARVVVVVGNGDRREPGSRGLTHQLRR